MAGHNRNLQKQNQLVRNMDFASFGKKGGRPRKYATPEEFEKEIHKYFGSITRTYQDKSGALDNNGDPILITEIIEAPTMSGLRNYLGLSRDGWAEYAKRDGYSDPAARAKSIIEAYLEQQLLTSQRNVQGIVFNLKNNFGWAEKVEMKQEVSNVNNVESFLKKEIGEGPDM